MESKVGMEKKVIKVLKPNENIVRDSRKKKNVMIYGLKEKVIPMRIKREKETKCIKKILKQFNDEDENTKFEEKVEEVMRLGPYIEGVRPIKLRLKTQTATEEILARTYKLRYIEDCKDMIIKKV